MIDQNCAYCMKGELVEKFGYFVMELPTSNLYLFKEQSHKGRVIVAYKKHVSEITALTDDERDAFFKDISTVSNAIHNLFKPNKVNYGAYGDTGCHLHFHLVPKYKNEFEWGGVFQMDPKQKYASNEELEQMASLLRNEINK